MANKPQSLSQGQQTEVTKILRKQVLTWTLTCLALLAGIMGVSLWQIKARVERNMESLVAAQFEEPRIRQIVQDAAATQATNVMLHQIQPEVDRFKAEITNRLAELEILVAKTKVLEQQSQAHEKKIQDVLAALQKALEESQATRDKIVGLQSDIVRMQECAARIQYYALKGRNVFPNPYQKEMVEALNEMLLIAIPDPAQRSKFITDLGGPNL
ncbi:MAG: hypothetical protein ABSB84_11670 [Verrucomicrobiota bacterium]|jgi:hypothetical protein